MAHEARKEDVRKQTEEAVQSTPKRELSDHADKGIDPYTQPNVNNYAAEKAPKK